MNKQVIFYSIPQNLDVYIYTCSVCGALVADHWGIPGSNAKEIHIKWHEEQSNSTEW